MKFSDFHIGLEFQNSVQNFRCTDVGTRTITAIALDKDDERWYVGPPYMVEERLFDEKDFKHLFVSAEQAIMESISEVDEIDLTYSSKAVRVMRSAKFDPEMLDYRNKALLRHDKFIDGEIHHPYAARLIDGSWEVSSYLPYLDSHATTPEADFRDARMAVHQDYLDSKARHRN